jgi:2-dehydropantoate 2-reductase
LKVLVLGSGMQGTLFGVRLARAGHHVTLIARGARARELQRDGAIIENLETGVRETCRLLVLDALPADTEADICLVMTRGDQIAAVLSQVAVTAIPRIVVMANQVSGIDMLRSAVGADRLVLAFPGFAGSIVNGVDQYVPIPEQPTAVDAAAADVIALIRGAGIGVSPVRDMESWLIRHVVFVGAISGALLRADGNAVKLAADRRLMRTLILAVREGWQALDRLGVAPAPFMLRMIFTRVPLPIANFYWRNLLASPRGENYFGRHVRHAPSEMSHLAIELLKLIGDAPTPHLRALFAAFAPAHPA